MSREPTHASFFSGVGGLDLGLERAGWRTVSFSEIDPYASAVLAERWPGVPNLGDIVHVDADEQRQGLRDATDGRGESGDGLGDESGQSGWRSAALWTGGFPCQDLSVAGKRRGMVEGTRSNLAYAFLALVERHRPPAILLENVPGLLSSHRGRDMAALIGAMVELGYGVAYRVLDARHFGVPQRRRRVFIVGLRSGPDDPTGRVAAERAAAVLAVGARCARHPAAVSEAGPEPPDRAGERPDIVGTVPAGLGHHGNGGHSSQAVAAGHVIAQALTSRQERNKPGDQQYVVGSSPDARGVRAADGLAGRLDDRELVGATSYHQRDRFYADLAPALDSYGDSTGDPPAVFVKAGRAQTADDGESWRDGDVMPTLNAFDVGDVRTTAAILGTDSGDDLRLPLGLDSHRYRCCGNGVVAPVAEWLGERLLAALESPASTGEPR